MFQFLILQLGVPALIGMALGYLLLGKSVNGERNVFGQESWDDLTAIFVGGLLLGVAFWFLLGFVLGWHSGG